MAAQLEKMDGHDNTDVIPAQANHYCSYYLPSIELFAKNLPTLIEKKKRLIFEALTIGGMYLSAVFHPPKFG
ncbi:MAG: hypothetical protein R2795_00010 [Saprospiraceae bacterium]